MAGGGIIGAASNPSGPPELHIDAMEISIDSDGIANVVIKSKQFKDAVVHTVKVAKKDRKIA
jgi:hypothetical protein